MTSPEKVADPPRCSAYKFAEETIMKNDIFGRRIGLQLDTSR